MYPKRTGGMGCIVEQVSEPGLNEYMSRGLSPDGKYIGLTHQEGKSENGIPIASVRVQNLETGEDKPVNAAMNNAGHISPDNSTMVSAIYVENGRTDIVLLDLETDTVTPVAAHEHWDWLPTFSPDGSSIVFNSYRVDDQADIYTYDRATGDLTRRTDDPRYEAHGEFSPDGTKIMFHRMITHKEDGGYDFEIFVIDLATGSETQITPGSPYEESYGSWAPDSAHLVFSSDHEGNPSKPNLYVLAPDGSIVSRLTKGDWKDSYAQWSRDGKYIYFNSDRDGSGGVYRIAMDGFDCVKGD